MECMAHSDSGLFLSMFEYTFEKDPEMAKIAYIRCDIQNEIIELMSKLVTEDIVEEEGNFFFFTIKIDGTRDTTVVC